MTANASTFQDALAATYPGAIEESAFVQRSSDTLARHGFTGDNSIASVCCCRDEISQTLHSSVTESWGLVFNKSSLAGMVLSGRTGFGAAQAHSPQEADGRERYVFFAMPHVAIGPEGEAGIVDRPGRAAPSSACGALLAVKAELEQGGLDDTFDPDDVEQSLLKGKIRARMSDEDSTDIYNITHKAYEAILDDLARTLDATFDPEKADLAVVTGIQIHGPGGVNYVQPKDCYAVVNGERTQIALD